MLHISSASPIIFSNQNNDRQASIKMLSYHLTAKKMPTPVLRGRHYGSDTDFKDGL